MRRRTTQGNGVHGHHLTLGAMAALILICGAARAADAPATVAPPAPSAQARFRIELPAQPLAESLRGISARTGTSVLFDPAAVGNRAAPELRGQFTAAEAIAKILVGSGLEPIVMPDGSIVVRAPSPRGAAPASRAAPVSGAAGSFEPGNGEGSSGGTPLAAAAQASVGPPSSGVAASGEPDGVQSLTRVEITGSRLKRIDADGPTPVNVYSRAEIERSGQPTLERFISSLNEASMSPGEGSAGQTTGQGSVQLRGLPLGSTLVLINGRRLQAVGSSSGNFFNLNLIPMAAVERVEIVPVGSSAVYGGDALAGVVNIILKKSIDGVAFDARLGSAGGTSDRSFSLGTGARGSEGSFLVLGSYSKTTPLGMAERNFFVDADYRRYGGLDTRSRACTPGTVTSVTGANLPGLSSSFAGIPNLTPGQVPSPADFAATAGQANLCNSLANGHGLALVFGTENLAMHAVAERQLGADWSAFGEITLAKDRLSVSQNGLLLSNVLVPATNPFNPFGVDVRVTSRLGLENGSDSVARATDFKRLVLGARGELGKGWDAEVSASSTRDDGDRVLGNTSVNVAARTAALAAANPALALNPFTAGRAASDDVLRSIWTDGTRESHGRKDQLSGFVRGAAAELPAGSLDVIAGAEASRDRYLSSAPRTFDIRGSRSSSAIYAEARVPLWRAAAPQSASRELAALTLAARRDHYSDFGSAGTYQAGLEVRPSKSTMLRGSVATSFKPPTLLQTHVDEVSVASDSIALVDPARGNAPITGAEVLRTRNPSLRPEKGRAYSLGAVWEPDAAAGARLAVTAWRVKIHGLISLPSAQIILNNEALFPGLVTRGPAAGGLPGPVTRILVSEVNFGGVDTAGVDIEATQAWRTGGTRWTLSASATRTVKYDVAISPGAPTSDRLAHRALDYWAPRWKGRVVAAVDRGGWNLGLTGRYLGGYGDMAPSDRRLGNVWVIDLGASVDLHRLGVRLPGAKTSQLSLAVANLTNRMPQFVGTFPFYDVTQADWRGRYASVHLSMNW